MLPEILNLLTGVGTSIIAGVVASIIPLIIRAINAYRESKKVPPGEKRDWKEDTKAFLNRFFPTWSGLKAFSTNRIFRLSYLWIVLVPLLAKFFSKTESAVNFVLQKAPEPIITLSLGVPFSWNLFYFGSLFFVIANILFYWKCPDIVKIYKDYSDFENREKSSVSLVNKVESFLYTSENREEYYRNIFYHYHGDDYLDLTQEHKQSFQLQIKMKTTLNDLANMFSLSLAFVDIKKLLPRILTTIMYFLSLCLYGYVTVEQSIFVTKLFFESIQP